MEWVGRVGYVLSSDLEFSGGVLYTVSQREIQMGAWLWCDG